MTSWKDWTKLRKRESEKLKTILELYDMQIHQKKAGPDYQRMKTMMKRSIEQDSRDKIFWSPETEIMKETPWSINEETKQREQRTLRRLLAMENQRPMF